MTENIVVIETQVVIEKNIPVPASSWMAKGSRGWGKIASEMEVGDSVLVKKELQANSLGAAIRALKFQPVQRKMKEGWRVWKTEKKS